MDFKGIGVAEAQDNLEAIEMIAARQPSPAPAQVPAIACHNLKTAYQRTLRRPILDGINCKVYPGEFVALLGLNGAGKSTLLRTLVGLTPVAQGQVEIADMPLAPRTLPQIRRRVGLLFQGGGLVPQLSALDNVLCGRLGTLPAWKSLWGFSRRDRQLALELLQRLGLQDKMDQKTSQLSGGQQQRVAIARALIQSPQILLVDEPVAGLDVLASQQVMEILADLHQQQGMTIVAVLHDLAIASAYTQRAVILEAGRVQYEGDCQNLRAQFPTESGLA